MRVRGLDRRISCQDSVHWQLGYFCAASISEPSMSGPLLGEGEGEGVRAGRAHTMAVVVVTSLQAEAPAAEYFPAAQSQQCAFEVAPVTAEYLPAVQSVQTVEAVPAAYFPAVQSVQTVEPVVRAQRQITSQIHMHMYICIEDVCVCVPIFMYVCMYHTYE